MKVERSDAAREFDWRSFDAYLFDIDGTLLNSRDAVHYDAFLAALREIYGRPLGLDGVVVHGSTDPLILLAALQRAGLGEAEARCNLQAGIARMCAEVETRAAELRPELCPAVPELLFELKAAGKIMGVASGNVERIGWAKLKAAGIAEFFSFGSFSDRHESRVEIFRWGAQQAQRLCARGRQRSVTPGARGRQRSVTRPEASVCFLGDTPADVAAARACGFPVIAIATGIYSLPELANSGPDICIPACESLWSSESA